MQQKPKVIRGKRESRDTGDLRNLERHMGKSFDMSGNFIGVFTTKKVDEINATLREKIFGGNL